MGRACGSGRFCERPVACMHGVKLAESDGHPWPALQLIVAQQRLPPVALEGQVRVRRCSCSADGF
jgi:hypothetical protein